MMEVRQQYASKFIKGEILDIGCGDGKLLDYYPGVGLDNNPEKITAAKEKGHEVYTRDIEHHPFEGIPHNPSKRFQHVVLTDVIEHFKNPTKTIEHTRKNQMAYDGSVIITTPNCGWLFWIIYASIGLKPHAWNNPDHKVCFTPHTLKKCLKDAGFTKFKYNSYGKIPYTNIYFPTPFQILACNIVVEAK